MKKIARTYSINPDSSAIASGRLQPIQDSPPYSLARTPVPLSLVSLALKTISP